MNKNNASYWSDLIQEMHVQAEGRESFNKGLSPLRLCLFSNRTTFLQKTPFHILKMKNSILQ